MCFTSVRVLRDNVGSITEEESTVIAAAKLLHIITCNEWKLVNSDEVSQLWKKQHNFCLVEHVIVNWFDKYFSVLSDLSLKSVSAPVQNLKQLCGQKMFFFVYMVFKQIIYAHI